MAGGDSFGGEGRRDNAPTSGATAEERYTKPKHEGADS